VFGIFIFNSFREVKLFPFILSLNREKILKLKRSLFFLFVILTLFNPLDLFSQISPMNLSVQKYYVKGGSYNLFVRAYTSSSLKEYPVLVVVLHGDAPPPEIHPNYQNIFASKIAKINKHVVAVALLRPGYTDPDGNHSEGDRGRLNGDNWNEQNTDAIADAIRKLKIRYHAHKVIVAGHSGGAAITANILGRRPGLIDAALLVSCPCGNVQDWRRHMLELTKFSVFEDTSKTLSPISLVKNISDKVSITLMTGTDDKVAPLEFSKQYKDSLMKEGKNITLIKLKGRPHNTFLYSKVYSTLDSVISKVERDIK
jgi:predicted esterase